LLVNLFEFNRECLTIQFWRDDRSRASFKTVCILAENKTTEEVQYITSVPHLRYKPLTYLKMFMFIAL